MFYDSQSMVLLGGKQFVTGLNVQSQLVCSEVINLKWKGRKSGGMEGKNKARTRQTKQGVLFKLLPLFLLLFV